MTLARAHFARPCNPSQGGAFLSQEQPRKSRALPYPPETPELAPNYAQHDMTMHAPGTVSPQVGGQIMPDPHEYLRGVRTTAEAARGHRIASEGGHNGTP